jgi:hypothetical protein
MSMKKGILLIAALCWSTVAWAQVQIYHDKPANLEKGATTTLTFRTPGLNVSTVQEATLFYKQQGSPVYRQMELEWNAGNYTADLYVDDEMNGTIQYYAMIFAGNNQTWTYPTQQPEESPVEVEVVDQKEEDKEPVAMDGTAGKIEYTILSPRPGETVGKDESLIAISLFYENENLVDPEELHLYLNDQEVTENASVSGYFISFVPEEPTPGDYNVRLVNTTNGKKQEIVAWDFSVAKEEQLASLVDQQEQTLFQGQAQLTGRNQMIAGDVNNMYRGSFRVSGEKGVFRYNLNGMYTSQDDPRLQPQNRYGGDIYLGKWFELHAGHTYPTLNPLMLAGRRMYGLNTALHLANRNINMQFMYGTLARDVSNLYTPIQAQVDTLADFGNGQIVSDTTFSYGFENNGRGTYERDIIGGRLSFGRSDKFQWGINLLKIQDDTSSITTLNGYNDVQRKAPDMMQSLSPEERQRLQDNPDLLSFNGSNPKPRGNFVAGTDLKLRADQGRIQFNAQAGASLLNDNIAPGILDKQAADDLGFDLDQGTLDLIDQLSILFIMNENITTLPIRLYQDNGKLKTETFVPMGIFAGQSRLNLNYLNNNLSVQYQWVGPDYTSLANTTIINDISGFNISDRINMLGNRVYLTVGYENTQNNLLGNLDATINTTGYRGNLSWYPIKQTLPRISVGYSYRQRENGVEQQNPLLSSSLVNRSVQNVSVAGQDTVALASAKLTETQSFSASVSQQFTLFNLRHDASVSYNYRIQDDQYFAYGGNNSQSYSANLKTQFLDLPLRTNVGLSYNTTEALGGLSTIDITGITAGATYFMFDETLSLSGNVAITSNQRSSMNLEINQNGTPQQFLDDYYQPNSATASTQESRSYIFNANIQYDINDNHMLMLNASMNNVVSTAQTMDIPNDRIIEARYVFRF